MQKSRHHHTTTHHHHNAQSKRKGSGVSTFLGAGGASGYDNTEMGQVIALAYLDAYTSLVNDLGGLQDTIGGQQAPIEFHFVHKDADGNLLVIGVMGIPGEHNDTFQPFVDAATAGATPAPASVDIAAMMPSSLLLLLLYAWMASRAASFWLVLEYWLTACVEGFIMGLAQVR